MISDSNSGLNCSERRDEGREVRGWLNDTWPHLSLVREGGRGGSGLLYLSPKFSERRAGGSLSMGWLKSCPKVRKVRPGGRWSMDWSNWGV